MSAAVIDLEVVLKVTAVTACLTEIADGRSPGGDGFGQDRADVGDQRRRFCTRQASGGACRTDACAEQRLLGIDVADPDHHLLIHDHRFERLFASATTVQQMLDGERGVIERFRSQVDQPWMGRLATSRHQIHQAETTGIAKRQAPSVHQVQVTMIVWTFITHRCEAPGAGHAQVAQQDALAGVEQQVFGAAAHAGDGRTAQNPWQTGRDGRPQITALQVDGTNDRPVAEQALQPGTYGLDLRQFGHAPRVPARWPLVKRCQDQRGSHYYFRAPSLPSAPMPLYLAGRSTAVAGRNLTITREKPFVIRTKTTNHTGEVQVVFSEGSYRLDNRSHMRCRINGVEQHQAVLANGDLLEIGKDQFAVTIEPDTRSITHTPSDEQDGHDTQSLSPVTVDNDLPLIEAPVVCAVCDARIVAGAHGRGAWSDGERHICARCLAKGVKPDHLPRPFSASSPSAVTPIGGSPILPDEISTRPVEDARTSSSSHAVAREGLSTSTDSDRQRQSRRISASRLTAVEPAQREGLLSKVGKVFGRRDERHQRLADLEADRLALLAEAGRHALGHGGSLGLPEKIVAALLAGGTVTVASTDLSQADLERWRAQRQRMVLLDVEIAALRKALGLGSDPQMHQQSSPTLRPDQKAMQDRAFATLDGLSTDELSRPEAIAPEGVIAVKTASSGRQRPVPARRRR